MRNPKGRTAKLNFSQITDPGNHEQNFKKKLLSTAKFGGNFVMQYY